MLKNSWFYTIFKYNMLNRLPFTPLPSFIHTHPPPHPRTTTMPNPTSSLTGLRTLLNLTVVAGHPILLSTLFYPSTLPYSLLIETARTPLSLLTLVLALFFYISVDGFLFISGFLLLHTLSHHCNDDRQQPLSTIRPFSLSILSRYTLSRWLRLTPLYFLATIFSYSRNLPNCPSFFEATLLTALPSPFRTRNTSIGHFAARCIGPGWSTAADFQIQLVVIFLLFLIRKWQRLIILFPLLIIASICLRAWFHTSNNHTTLPPYIGLSDMLGTQTLYTNFANAHGFPTHIPDTSLQANLRRLRTVAYDPLYYHPLLRGGALFMGCFVWVCMRTNNGLYKSVKTNPTKYLRMIMALITIHAVTLKPAFEAGGSWWGLVHESCLRIAMAAVFGIVTMLTCTVRKDDPPCMHSLVSRVRNVLSCRVLSILGKVSYAVYLLHMATSGLVTKTEPRLKADNLCMDTVLIAGVRWYLGTVVLALPFWILEWSVLDRIRKWIVWKLFAEEGDVAKDVVVDVRSASRFAPPHAGKGMDGEG